MNKAKMLKIFIGYDAVEVVAWHTLAQSIIDNAKIPVALIPLRLDHIKDFYWRERDPKQSNEFSFSRFLVPHLSDYQGYAIFMDCDMLLRVDISEVLRSIEAQPNKAVYVVKHDYESTVDIKYLNNKQYSYPRKNWSSFILWNCEHPSNKKVDLEYVNNSEPKELHRFLWLNDDEIGELDVRWNWLVGEYKEPPNDVKNVHWTIGGPYFNEFKDVDFSNEWLEYKIKINFCKQRD